VTIPASIETIEDSAFEGCTNLKKINFAPISKLEVIGKRAFMFDAIQELVLPSSVKELHMQAFMWNKLKKLVLNDGLREIDRNAFSDCKGLQEVFIPKSVYRIGINTFLGCWDMIAYVEATEIALQWDENWSDEVVPCRFILGCKRR